MKKKVYSLSRARFEKEKQVAQEEMALFFVKRFRQEEVWQLTSAIHRALVKKELSNKHVQCIVDFLIKKFEVNQTTPVVQAPSLLGTTQVVTRTRKRPRPNEDLYLNLFGRLQHAVSENRLECREILPILMLVKKDYPMIRMQ